MSATPPRFTMGPALLFCPADRPERFDKAAARADAVILDLEDAVAPATKPLARQALVGSPLDPDRTIVRVNPVESDEFAKDMAALVKTRYRVVMVAKSEQAAALNRVGEYGDYGVIALCETAAGVLAASAIAAEPAVVGLMWGAEDLVASLGGMSSRDRDGRYRQVAHAARSHVLLAAGAHGKAAIDAVHLDIPDLAGLSAEAEDAAASGFQATACIHPGQVDAIRRAYRPSDEELTYAREVLDAAASERGVFQFRGRMIDAPVLRHAERVIARSAR